jgi:hypothetical protein
MRSYWGYFSPSPKLISVPKNMEKIFHRTMKTMKRTRMRTRTPEEVDGEDDGNYFEWDNEDSNDDYTYHRVWVERKWIDDATDSFHP